MIDQLKQIIDNWRDLIVTYLPKIFLASLLLLLFIFLAKLVKNILFKTYSKSVKKHAEIASIIGSLIYFFFLLSGVFLALKIVGMDQMLSNILVGAGILGIVAGFAFKDIASNIFAGLLLKLQHPFKKDDWVKIDENYGKILVLGWITTSIETNTGQEIFIPNQIIYNKTFINYSVFNKRRVILETGVAYGDDLEHVKAVAIDEVKKIDLILPEEEVDLYFTSIGNSSYNFQLRFWIRFTNEVDYKQALSETIMRIKKRFEKEDISIAYSIITLDFAVKGGVNIFDKEIQLKK